MNKTKGCLIANFATVPVVRGAKTVVVRGKNRILTQNREKLEMTVPIS
uniref:Uncharacterized protein n=1 Tax=Escherichia coli TaxID=562 RepID=A0A6M6A0D1_ECOLX|nr:hypothetical protein [Escherichia coli]QJX10937.1 hypothetical protein [Escherichia coli]